MLVVEAEYEGKSLKKAFRPARRSGQFGTCWNRKSVQEVSKHFKRSAGLQGHHGKTDIRHWLGAVFRQKYTRNGLAHHVSEWAIKIQHVGRRETFPLGTANRAAAAAKAKDIYLSLQASGWEETLAKFKPKANTQCRTANTVGDFLEQVTASAGGRSKTIEGYCRAFRTIVTGIFNIEGGPAKFDYRPGGGREKWIARIHAVPLSDVTPDKVQKWKVAFLQRAETDPVKRRAARISVNSLMRQAKSLFTADRLKFIRLNIHSTPFEGVRFEPRQSMRYRSPLRVEKLIEDAQRELPIEELKILLLALMVGLRRNEIDKLEWSAFRWKEGIIRIETTRYFHPKSEDSVGDVEVDPELSETFRGFRAGASGDFVIESEIAPRPGVTYAHYRCQRLFKALAKWLRVHGVTGNKPLHTLRKEFGSQVCARHGIYAASQALRHADIAITSAHYVAPRKRSTVGLGNLLRALADMLPINGKRESLGLAGETELGVLEDKTIRRPSN